MPGLTVAITGNVLRETSQAVLFYDGTRHAWLPTSQISDRRIVGTQPDGEELEELDIPEWLAQAKELI